MGPGRRNDALLLPAMGPAAGSRSSSAGMNRIKFVGFVDSRFSTAAYISALSHTPEQSAV